MKETKLNLTEFSVTTLQKRLLSLTVAIAFLFCLLIGRFFYVQVIWGKKLVAMASDQWNREIPVVASRGVITDTNGAVLATNRTTYTVFARPNAVTEKGYAAAILSATFGLDERATLEKLNKKKSSEVTIVRHAEAERIEKLVSFQLSGVYYARDNTRIYPYGDTLCQVLGFTSTDSYGQGGLEKFYDSYLCGTNGEILYETDIVGIQTEEANVIYRAASDGAQVRLTIDVGIQLSVEEALKQVYLSSGAKNASCIVLDPQDFSILAMANYPSYDLNEVPRNDPTALNTLSRNALVCDIYEPGSTFKVVTAAANLEEYLQGNTKAYSPSTIFNSSRTRSVDGTTIKCWATHDNGRHANQTLAEALNNSCNPCFTDMALALGQQKFYEYLSLFGFGKSTGIDFMGEANGLLVPKSIVRDCDLARIGFGQSVAVTGIQLACAVAAAVNGGNYYIPHIMKSITSQGKILVQNDTVVKHKAISEKASDILRTMLEGVVKEGSGKKAYIEGYRVGGKTGTAQKYEDGHIAQGKYISSFVGFFPADKPQYLALIVVDEPQGTYYGSAVAAPVAKQIFEDIILLKHIKPFS